MSTVRQPLWIYEHEIPKLPEGWRVLRTEEACIQLKPGKLFETKTVVEEGEVPVLNQSGDGYLGYHNEAPGVEASAETPVVTFANHTCALRLMKTPFSSIQNVFPKVGVPGLTDTTFFYYAVLGRVGFTDYKGHHPLFRQMFIPVPPLPTQRRIAGILSAYDELIANNQRRIAILEEMARALYRKWFVHTPQDGEELRLADVTEVYRGRSYRTEDLGEEEGLPFLNLKCMDREGGFRRTGIKRYIGEYKDHHVVRKGDIIMAVTDMTQERAIVARAAWVPTLDQDFGVMSMDLVRIEPKPGLSKVFLYCFLRYSGFADEVKQHANGANVLHLSPDRIKDFRITLPSSEAMEKFAQAVSGMLELKDTLENQSENLRRTRDLLLPRLMSGRVEVSQLQGHVEAE